MSAPFKVGDLVVCVNADPCPVHGPVSLVLKRVYRVVRAKVGRCKTTGFEAFAVKVDRDDPPSGVWHAELRFRKINPLQDLDTLAKGKTFKLPKPVLDPARHHARQG